MTARGAAVAGVVVAGVVWTLLAYRAGPLLLPTPSAVGAALVSERGRLFEAATQTGLAAVAGLAVATVIGLVAALAAFASRVASGLLAPWMLALQVVPIVAIAPLLVVWLGYGLPVSLATAVFASIFPVYSAGRTGLGAASRDQVDVLRLYGATPLQILLQLRMQLALPALFAGFRVAAGLAVIGAIIGEFVGSNGVPPTLGQTVVYAARSARTDVCFAAIAWAGVLAASLQAGIAALERAWIGRWYGR